MRQEGQESGKSMKVNALHANSDSFPQILLTLENLAQQPREPVKQWCLPSCSTFSLRGA